jgi:hypothetical protein
MAVASSKEAYASHALVQTTTNESTALQDLAFNYQSHKPKETKSWLQGLVSRVTTDFWSRTNSFQQVAGTRLPLLAKTPFVQKELALMASYLMFPCYSSVWMSKLMSWRNPATEMSWSDPATEQPAQTKLERIGRIAKVAATELCMPALAITASIEAVAYNALGIVSRVLRPITEAPYNFMQKKNVFEMAGSSLFTVSWTVRSLWHNLRETTLPKDEFEARKKYQTSAA